MNVHRPKEKVLALFVFLLPLMLVKGGGVLIDGPARAVIVEHQPSGRAATLKVPLPR
ncbi:MAG: hypothetical protein ACYS15_07510 [Planctomycetota bacterium]|jgi:hypothetical protein